MKSFIIKVLFAWVLSSFFGIFSFLDGSSKSFLRVFIPYWVLYALFVEIWVIFIYLIIQLFLYWLKIIDRNVFFSIGLIGVLFNFILRKFDKISTTGDFLYYLPSLVLILVGTAYWLWERNKKKV